MWDLLLVVVPEILDSLAEENRWWCIIKIATIIIALSVIIAITIWLV